MPIYDKDPPWGGSRKELWKRRLKMKQRIYLGCYFSLHKYQYQVKVHVRNSQLREDSATENEEYPRKTRAMAGL